MKYLVSLLLLLSSCSSAWHLQQADKHIQKAKIKGADVKSDTTYKKVTFDITGAKTQIDLGPTILHRKDGVVSKYILKDTVIYKDNIRTEIKNNTVFVECPDEHKEVSVPVAVDTTIKAGYTKWQLITNAIGVGLLMFIVGFILSRFVKVPWLPF